MSRGVEKKKKSKLLQLIKKKYKLFLAFDCLLRMQLIDAFKIFSPFEQFFMLNVNPQPLISFIPRTDSRQNKHLLY